MPTVVVVLDKIMEDKKIGLHELVEKSGVSNVTIMKYVRKEVMQVDLEVLAKLCQALEVGIEDILILEV